jgi:DNA modification methylase
MSERLTKAAEIANKSKGQVLIWVKQNEEGAMLKKLIDGAIEVSGSDKPEYKEKTLLAFANGDFRVLITKASIAQFGLNFQKCQTQIFASLDFSFEGFYQSVRRSYRFGQKNDVHIHIISTDTMQNVVAAIKQKQSKFLEMQAKMNKSINAIKNTSNMEAKDKYQDSNATIMRGDCIKLIKEVPSESIGFSVFSPPFAELYVYSDHIEDMGNSKDYNEFKKHFKFLCKELYRVMQTGRNVAIHCMDLPIQKGKEGVIGLRDFSGIIREAMEDSGFIYHCRVTIWKNPVTEMQRTKALGLLHKQVKKDSAMSRVGIPDYLMVFRKDGESKNPVKQQDTDPSKPNYLPVDLWQKYASPVWMDIDYGNTLQYTTARDGKDEKHICPLQLDTIQRAVHLWSNEGDIVLTPFMGIGSEVFQAIKMKRKAIGFELKESYFNIACENTKKASLANSQMRFF